MQSGEFEDGMSLWLKGKKLVELGPVSSSLLKKFELDSDVFYADFVWDHIIKVLKDGKISLNHFLPYTTVQM